ncbi:hypothetical protein ACF0H5_004073 [Mactra antiquata]
MGLNIGIHVHTISDSQRGDIEKCVSEKKYKKFPLKYSKVPLSQLLEFKAYPVHEFRNRRLDPNEVFWWPDAQFLPNDDTVLFVTAGVFDPRPNHAWVTFTGVPNGRILKIELGRDTLGGEVFVRSRMSNLPKIQMHPSGEYIGFIHPESIKIETIMHEDRYNKYKDLRSCNYRYCTFAPNGKYMAVILSASRQIELLVSMVHRGFSAYDKSVNLSKLIPGFTIKYYNEHIECKWSPDSGFIAVCSSIFMLFVMDKNLNLILDVTQDVLPENTFPSWSSTFDFDPCCFHEYLVVGSNTRCLYFVNITSKEIVQKTETISSSSIDCVQFVPNGSYVCVATRDFVLHMIDASDMTILYKIDMTVLSPNLTPKFSDIPNVVRLSFSNTGEQIATSTTDGKIRVYQLTRDISLFNLCKWEILSLFPQSDIQKLPLPREIISKLLSLPTVR